MQYKAEDIITRCDALKGERCTLDSHLQEVCDLCLPRKAQITTTRTEGQKYQVDTYDSTAILALDDFAAGLFSFLTPPDKMWFQIRKRGDNSEDVKRYFAEVTSIIYKHIQESNFALNMYESFLDLGWAGIFGMMLEEGNGNSIYSFRNLHYTTYYISEDNKGLVDTLYRKFELTAKQAYQEFGEDLSSNILECAKEFKSMDKKFEFIHFITKRTDRDPTKLDSKNKPWASVYVDCKGKKIIKESGYDEQPFATPRFAKDNFEIYGRSPAMASLPNIKMANAMMKTIIAAAQKVVDPPLLVPNNNTVSKIRTTPGSIIYFNPTSPSPIPQILQTDANIGLGMDLLNVERDSIRKAFMTDMFAMFQQQDRKMTATEILARLEEKLTLFAPNFGRLVQEFFNVILERAYGIAQRAGVLPDPPPELLLDNEYEIQYTSKLALAIKSIDMKASFEFLQLMEPLMTIDPTLADNLNFDAIVRSGTDKYNLDPSFIRKEEEVKEIRAGRAQRAQMQQQMEQAQGVVDAVPKLSKAPEEGSPIQDLKGMLGM